MNIYKKSYLLLMLSCVSVLVNAKNKATTPMLIVHFDINKTIMAEDPAGGKSLSDVLIGALAETYKDRWDSGVSDPITYKEYVELHLFPGQKGDGQLKKLRKEQIVQFIEYLSANNHPLHQEVQQKFKTLHDKLNGSSSIVFTSFYRGLEYLKNHEVMHAIVLRTFGEDLDRIIDEIHTWVSPDFFSWRGEFKDGILTLVSLRSNEIVRLETTAEIYEFLKTHGNVAIHDDWKYWNKHGECKEFGKLFPIDAEDYNVISLFADDNAHPQDGILNPRHPHTNESLDTQTLIDADYVRIVDPLQAIEQDDYFVDYFHAMLTRCSVQTVE